MRSMRRPGSDKRFPTGNVPRNWCRRAASSGAESDRQYPADQPHFRLTGVMAAFAACPESMSTMPAAREFKIKFLININFSVLRIEGFYCFNLIRRTSSESATVAFPGIAITKYRPYVLSDCPDLSKPFALILACRPAISSNASPGSLGGTPWLTSQVMAKPNGKGHPSHPARDQSSS